MKPDYPSLKNIPVAQEIGGKAYAIHSLQYIHEHRRFHTIAANMTAERMLKPGEVIIGKWDERVERNGTEFQMRTFYIREAQPYENAD